MPAQKKILIIEDSKLLSTMLEARFREKEFEVLVSSDGADGLQKAKEKSPDIIILDLILPKLSGEYVCKEIRNDQRLKQTRIIMVTTKDNDADRIIGKVIGADIYLPKPLDMDKLLQEIERLIAE
jgi:DNA-binding response OmpR family regulator